jgi:ankyrin repeat protein
MPMLENFRLTFDYAARHLWVTWNPPKSIAEQLATGLDPNSRDLADETPLMRAARRGDAAGVTALIAAGAKVDAQAPRGNTALRYAVEHGDIDVVRLFLAESSNGINSTTDLGETPLMAAADSSSPEILPALLAAGTDPKAHDKHKATALHHAAQHGNVSAIEALCKAGADLEGYCDRDLTPLALAAAHGSVEAFDALITAGAKPDAWLGNHVTLLHNAAFSGNPEMVRHILRDLPMKVDVNASTFDGYTPLITAAEFGNARAVEILLEAGANVAPATAVRLSGTALHLASINGHTEIVRLLLKHGAATEARCLLGRTPLILAALTSRDEVLSALLSAGAKIEARDDAGGTALQAAAAMGHADAVRILLNAGASVNAKATRNGRTALHIAASGGHENLIMILLAAGANPAAKDDAGANAADAARAADYELTAQMLEWTARGSH